MNKKCKYCKVGKMVLRKGKWGDFYGCTRYPECGGIEKISQPVNSLEEQANELLNEKPI